VPWTIAAVEQGAAVLGPIALEPLEDLDTAAARYAYDRAEADQARQRTLRDDFLTFCLPFAGRLARRFRGRGERMQDLEQVASLGLVKAVDRYHPDRGSFTAFAISTITGELKRHFRDHTSGVHIPRPDQEFNQRVRAARSDLLQQLRHQPTSAELADHLGVPVRNVYDSETAARAYAPTSLNQLITDGGDERGDLIGDADPELQSVDDRITLRHLMRRLPQRERTLLSLRFYGNYSQQQVAERLGISQMQVSRLQQRALTWLRAAMLSDTPPPWTGPDDTDHGLSVTIDAGHTIVTAHVRGEIDCDNAEYLRRQLLDATATCHRDQTLRIHLAGVPLLDAAAAAVLAAVGQAGLARGITVRITGLQPFAASILATCGARDLVASPPQQQRRRPTVLASTGQRAGTSDYGDESATGAIARPTPSPRRCVRCAQR
jgi:RNA polymerase sigma-B factor